MQPQQPMAPRRTQRPVAPGHFDEPPTQPLPRPFPGRPQHRTLPPPQLPIGAGWWAPAAFPAPGVVPRRGHLPLYLAAAATVATAIAAIAGFWAPGFFVTRQLDVAAVQAGVAHVLSDPAGYGARDVSDVSCNDGQNPTVTKGGTFTCQVTIDHLKHQFVVTFTDDSGGYEVSDPKGTQV
ncbi:MULTISPECIES: DUF4333 domain-containing protein [unclassified Mycobacterium]|uniref:DUF4333 domain-containing protein n=1 Tax=unclassified Mycobacterium TaxID=2642494 RepID=UPI000801E79A|nr:MULTISPECIES: DUF4333 domain-containing protein [unclassified Mycobacterium]OBG57164.1 hypothetical protein A5703_05525 [Mycobacterium sp. E188]OBH38745.1 hypothetical protein A5691_23740 [Mycobacterium sp. E183]